MKREKLVKEAKTTPFTGENRHSTFDWNDKMWMDIAKDTDVIWSTIIFDLDEIKKMLNIRKWSGAKWIVDMDDNFYAVARDNPAQANSKVLRDNFDLCLRLCDGVTVSVPMLKDLYGSLNPNIYVMPNAIDFTIWDKVSTKKHKGIRIGWEGAYGHRADLALVSDVVRKICKDYDCTFVVLGIKPDFPCEWHDWVPLDEYPAKLASLNLDIGIAPLVDSSYNRCKSNLRWLEFSALKIPVVYSEGENQKDLPGISARSNYDWYNALERLQDAPRRTIMGKKQYNHVQTHFDIKRIVHPLAEWFEQLPRRTDLEPKNLQRT